MRAVLAAASLGGFLAVLALLAFWAIPEINRDFFNIGLGALIGYAGAAIQFYLGSSSGSAEKTQIMSGAKPPEE
jgi:hypothetical protein